MTRTCLLTVVLGALLPLPARANLFSNGSFEAPAGFHTGSQGVVPPSWESTNSTPDLYSTDGSFGLHPSIGSNFTGVSAQEGLGWIAGWSLFTESFAQQLPTALAPSTSYTFTGWLIQAKRSDLDNPGAYDIMLNSTNSLTGAVTVATVDPTTNLDTWEFRTESFMTPANSGSLPWLIFRPYQSGADGAYPGLDNISLSAATTPPLGDANGDGCVSGADFTIWNDHFGAGPGALLADGDFTGDGFVTGADFTVWNDHFGEGCAPATAVPEPRTWFLGIFGFLAIRLCFASTHRAFGHLPRRERRNRRGQESGLLHLSRGR